MAAGVGNLFLVDPLVFFYFYIQKNTLTSAYPQFEKSERIPEVNETSKLQELEPYSKKWLEKVLGSVTEPYQKKLSKEEKEVLQELSIKKRGFQDSKGFYTKGYNPRAT